MLIGQEADYAVRIVQCLANDGERLGAKTIAKKTNVTERFTLKILHKLVNAGVLKSFKGVGGGYELAREPQNITLKEVIEVIEGPLVIMRCQQDNYECSHGDCICYFYHIFNETAKDIAKRFENVNFLPKNCTEHFAEKM